jgi:hypothetical protein
VDASTSSSAEAKPLPMLAAANVRFFAWDEASRPRNRLCERTIDRPLKKTGLNGKRRTKNGETAQVRALSAFFVLRFQFFVQDASFSILPGVEPHA